MLIIIGIIVLLVLIFNFLYFILPVLSPIPFFPTNSKDVAMIIKSLIELDGYMAGGSTGGGPMKRATKRAFHGTRERQAPPTASHSQIIIDLGAGTGTVIFAAATKSYNEAKIVSKQYYQPRRLSFIAVEIHPLLILILHLRRLFHPNRKNIKIIRSDIFKMNYKKNLRLIPQNTKYKILNTIYLYVGTPALLRLKPQLEKLPPGSRVVSYMYQIPGWENRLKKTTAGVKKLYYYSL